MNYIKALDQFGINFIPTHKKHEQQFKSFIGGLASVLLYSACLAYFIYKLYLWQSNQLLPKISVQQSTAKYLDVYFQNSPFVIALRDVGAKSTGVDPFSEQNNIITPWIIYIDGFGMSQRKKVFPTVRGSDGFSSYIRVDDLNLVLNVETGTKPQRQLMLLLEICNPSTLVANQTCASKEETESYLKQPLNMIFLNIQLAQFDTKLQRFDTIQKQIYLLYGANSTIYGQVLFQTATSNTISGLLFDSQDTYQYVNNFEFTTQQMPADYFLNSLQMNLIAAFLFRVDTLSINEYIYYPKLGEILADVGSIMSSLLMLRIFIILINQNLLQYELLSTIAGYYYPQLRELKISKNLFGKVQQVTYRGRKLENQKKFMIYYQGLLDMAEQKLTVTNQLYEISRLQFCVHALLRRADLQHVHQVGIKLNQVYFNNSVLLDPEDFKGQGPKTNPTKELDHMSDQDRAEMLDDADYSLFALQINGKEKNQSLESPSRKFFKENQLQ